MDVYEINERKKNKATAANTDGFKSHNAFIILYDCVFQKAIVKLFLYNAYKTYNEEGNEQIHTHTHTRAVWFDLIIVYLLYYVWTILGWRMRRVGGYADNGNHLHFEFRIITLALMYGSNDCFIPSKHCLLGLTRHPTNQNCSNMLACVFSMPFAIQSNSFGSRFLCCCETSTISRIAD